MRPVIALVGRPNVGKSTLFNRLTRSRDAIVADAPGVTRDRRYGDGRFGGHAFIVIDTGGIAGAAQDGLAGEVERQAEQAIAEADVVLLLVDARAGATPADRAIAERLRKRARGLQVVANKAEGMQPDVACAEFHAFGLGAPLAVSAAHGEGIAGLIETVLGEHPAFDEEAARERDRTPRIAVVGRPNVGKSTLVNALVGEERVIAFDAPGTTRDPVDVPFERGGRRYVLVDTAGLRRRGRQGEAVEQFSIVKTLQAIEAANVAIFLLDACDGVHEQDAHVAGYILERGRALVVAVNKWDVAPEEARARIKQELAWKLGFLGFARTHMVSAKRARGLGTLMQSVDAAYAAAMARLSTPRLTRAMFDAVARQAPPRSGVIRPKLRYAHQGGVNPPRVIIHGSALDRVPETYRRYLEGAFRKAFELHGTPLAVEFRTRANPYVRQARR